MVHRHATVAEAYAVLGLSEDASLEVVKSTYKQLALKTHPDKNPGNADATAQFQRISEAYDTLVRHLDRPAALPHGGHSHSHSHSHSHFQFHPFGYDDEDYYDDDDYYYEDDYYDEYESDYEERMDFFKFLFEELMRGHASRDAHRQYRRQYRRPQTPAESEEQYSARLRRAREEQEQAAERRAREEANRKANQERERERQRREAGERQRKKNSAKKAEAAASRMTVEQKVRTQQEQAQTRRSDVFAAARRKNADVVKKGVWEDNVDASGVEILKGSEGFVKDPPADVKETLLHIASNNGDLDLVQWLDSHSAEPDERNGEDMTAFHIALKRGHAKIVTHFFEAYPPKDADHAAIYRSPEPRSNIQLALDSKEPAMVWAVLDKRLHDKQEMDEAWKVVTSKSFKSSIPDPSKYDEFVNLFKTFGNYSTAATASPSPPPPSESDTYSNHGKSQQSRRPRPTVTVEDDQSYSSSPVSETPPTPLSTASSMNNPHPRRGQYQHRRSYRPHYNHHQPSSPVADRSSPLAGNSHQSGQQPHNYRGRGRGRGRGQFRGRGRGRGRGEAPVAA
ncbi:hypothetical protein C8Q80DRAFT_1170004 [Daedaleopsis nitida]|nr:hypothetical protein C8Q80DRAFT_1170004 [Daedaleopsis nitida]